MRHAISVSSDEYFYTIGGGYKDQKGLGIENIENYMKIFGFGSLTDSPFSEEKEGNVPNIKWKEENFAGDPWRVGDTYNSSIGQYGFQVTTLQVVRAISAIANDGTLLKPKLLLDTNTDGSVKIPVNPDFLEIIKEGMRLSVLEGTASALYLPQVKIAAKTGTAELGTTKQAVNSWVTGFFPYENPRYAFAAVLEKGHRSNTIGASYVMRQLLDWMSVYKPEYVK
jgi:penicillin-binding protein 2